MQVSVVIRTLNEERYLGSLLQSIRDQRCDGLQVEIVLIDSGSTDATVEIAHDFGCVITTIKREEFSFGRSLNRGCEAASGELLLFVSGHCVPTDLDWLQNLCEPILCGQADFVYGRQLGGPDSMFSECRIFEKYYPSVSRIPQQGFFCNNANSAISRKAWLQHRFDENLTGLEDMDLAKRLCETGGAVAYVAEAQVLHHHHERWRQVKRRFEREALALQKIMPQIHITPTDTVRYILSSVLHDWRHARRRHDCWHLLPSIVKYRMAQYIGSYAGNHQHRVLSNSQKDSYFYPSTSPDENFHDHTKTEGCCTVADEGKQRASTR